MYLVVKRSGDLLEGRQFVIYTVYRPLTFVLRSKPDKYSLCETRHLDFVSQFTSDIRHISNEHNVTADALSRLPINSLSLPSDIDLQQIALDQPRRIRWTGKFTYLPVPTSDTQMICNTSIDSPHPLVPNNTSSDCL